MKFPTNITDISNFTDIYFTKTKDIIINSNYNATVVYGFFLRTKSIFALKPLFNWLEEVKKVNDYDYTIHTKYKEGDIVDSTQALFYLKGSLVSLLELEPLILHQIAVCNVSALNAYQLSNAVPNTALIAMGNRACFNPIMNEYIDYGVSVGSKVAQEKNNAKGFLGTSVPNSSKFYNNSAIGTMPHVFIGLYSTTLEAAKAFYAQHTNPTLTILVDYHAQEITDSLEVCNYFSELANVGKLLLRIDTSKERYIEGLNKEKSLAILEEYNLLDTFNTLDLEQQEHAIGAGVSVAAIYHLRKHLDHNNFSKVQIIASSGFSIDKLQVVDMLKAPVDIIGTGQYIPNTQYTRATADVICYNNQYQVKQGRDFLIQQWKQLIQQ